MNYDYPLLVLVWASKLDRSLWACTHTQAASMAVVRTPDQGLAMAVKKRLHAAYRRHPDALSGGEFRDLEDVVGTDTNAISFAFAAIAIDPRSQ